MALIDEAERRAELAVKVAMLEERSLQGQKQLDRIETALVNHANEEELVLKAINTSLVSFKTTIEEKLVLEVGPIKRDLDRYKTIIAVVSAIGSVVVAVIVFFKDFIFSLFTGGHGG